MDEEKLLKQMAEQLDSMQQTIANIDTDNEIRDKNLELLGSQLEICIRFIDILNKQ